MADLTIGSNSLPADLNIKSQPDTDKDYFRVTCTGLKTNTNYNFQFQYVFPDKTTSDWSPTYFLKTAAIGGPNPPKFDAVDLTYFQGILNITWNGLDSTGNPYGKEFDRINVYVKNETEVGTPYRYVGSLKAAGTLKVPVPPVTHSVKLTVVTVEGVESLFSAVRVVTPTVTPPTPVTGISASWSGTTFNVVFNSDPSSAGNEYLKEYKITLVGTLYTKPFTIIPVAGSQQRFSLSLDKNREAFGEPQLQFSSGYIQTVDIWNNIGTQVSFSPTGYVSSLTAPVISLTEIVNGYKVAYTQQTSADFKLISVEEVVSDSSTPPTSGFQGVATGSENPLVVPSGTGKRWVRARLFDQAGAYTGYSNVAQVIPIDIVAAAVDALAPDPIQSATAVGGADPSDSGGTLGLITLSIVNAVSTVPSDFNGYIVKIIRSSDSKEWTQQINSKTYLTSIPINLGIAVGQTYTLSVSTTDGRNQSAFVPVTGNPISVTDTRSNTTVATNISLSATDSILTVKWTPINDARVASYRVQLTSNADTNFTNPLQEVYANSSVVSFGGLSASTTYRIRVTSKFGGPAGALSTNHLVGTVTLDSSGAISDGVAPTTNPSITTNNIKSLFGAFAITFPQVTNSDAVTYEVFIKPTNSTGIVDNQYKVLEVSGTFAVIKTLADKETALSYGTNYYIAIRAKDNDGVSTGTVTPVGPVQTLQVQNADLAADSVYANNIKAGEIDASKMITDLLFASKTINVGETTTTNRVRLDGNTVTMTDSDLPTPSTYTAKGRIFIGAGNYYSNGTSFYADNTGRLSIGDKLKFDGTNLTVNGSGTFTGLLTTGTGSNLIKVGTGANGANNGIYIQAGSQYIYTDGTFSFGGGSLTGTSSSLNVSGTMTVKGNSELQGDLKLVSPGVFYIGANKASGQRLLINDAGIAAYNSSGTKLFGLDTTGYLEAKSAEINGWLVSPTTNPSSLYKTSGTGTIKLDSATASVQADGPTYTAGFGLPDANGIVFWAGGSRALTANFYVKSDGSVKLGSATITGYASTSDLDPLAKKDMSNVTTIDGGKITTGIVKSANHTGVTDGSNFTTAGTAINLTNGTISSPKFRINASGDAFFAGTLSSGVSISSPVITGGSITGSSVTVTDAITSSGLTAYSDSGLSEGSDADASGTNSSINIGTTVPTLTLQSGKLSSTGILQLVGASYTEILSGGAQSAVFSNDKSSMQFTTGLYLGDPNKSSQSNVQSTSSTRVPWISIDASLRLRKGAPLLYPGGTAGAYVRNIYIKQTTATTISSTTGNIGDIFITY
ncbi:MAG: hypothetical protein RLZZ196_18 [Bacteroidota bacterium]|jgi:hypothetical protein